MKNNIFLIFFILFSFAIKSEEENQSPYVWLVEKNGKVSYFLGTIHAGVSLDEMPYSEYVINQLKNSDLLFIEDTIGHDDYYQLSFNENKLLYVGTQQEREEIKAKLSLETIKAIENRIEIKNSFLRNTFPFPLAEEGNGVFSELNQESQDFLIKYGADLKGSYIDFFHFIRSIAYSDGALSFPQYKYMDRQIRDIAFSHSIKVQGLDDNEILKNESNVDENSSQNDLSLPVNSSSIEDLIENYDEIVETQKDHFLSASLLYKTWDIEKFIELLNHFDQQSSEIFLKNRNKIWAEKFIEAHTKYQSVFLSAGLIHFVGENNLLNTLIEKDFAVERLSCRNLFDNRK